MPSPADPVEDPLAQLLDRRLARWGFDVPPTQILELAAAVRYAEECDNCQINNGQPCNCPTDVDTWGWRQAPE